MSLNQTTIAWTAFTLQVVYGCTRCSPGCGLCYAFECMLSHAWKALARMIRGLYPGAFQYGLPVVNAAGTDWSGEIILVLENLQAMASRRVPTLVFINSLSDTFHPAVPDWFIIELIRRLGEFDRHHFLLLTKRAERLAKLSPKIDWPPNVSMGVTVEDGHPKRRHRIDCLRSTGAAIKFLSIEPMLSAMPDLDLSGIDWVICGGESGSEDLIRPMHASWVTDLRDQCVTAGVAFFLKQWGHLGNNPDQGDPTAKANGGTVKGGCLLQGRTWHEVPAALPAQFAELINRDLPDITPRGVQPVTINGEEVANG